MLPTPRLYAGTSNTVAVTCRDCRHSTELDMAALAQTRHADTPLIELRLRCSACGSAAVDRVVVSVGVPRADPREWGA